MDYNQKFSAFKHWYKTYHPKVDLKAQSKFVQSMRIAFLLGLEKASEAKFKKEISELNVEDEVLPDLRESFNAGFQHCPLS